jgi:hypothetical protein
MKPVAAAVAPRNPILPIHGAEPEERTTGIPRPCGPGLLEARAQAVVVTAAVEVARRGSRWSRLAA